MRLSLRTLTVIVLLAAAILLVAVHRPASRARAALRPAADRAAGILAAAGPRPADSARGTCPAIAPAKPVTSVAAGAGSSLVPGSPTVALLCRYSGLSEPTSRTPGFDLVGQARITGAAVSELAGAFDALAPFPSGVAFSCPAAFGTSALIFFGYASGRDAAVTSQLSGCSDSENGHLTRQGVPPQVTSLTAGSPAFVTAHSATLTVRLTGDLKGLSLVITDANGDATQELMTIGVHTVTRWVAPGRDTVSLRRQFASKVIASTHVTVAAGRTAAVALTVS